MIAQATTTDVDGIAAIFDEAKAWLHARGIHQWEESRPANWLSECVQRGEFFVAREPEVVGMFRLVWTDEENLWTMAPAGYLGKLVVCRKYAGRGIGLKLLAAADRIISNAERSLLRLDCWAGNTVLIDYYTRAGFRKIGLGNLGGVEVCLLERIVRI